MTNTALRAENALTTRVHRSSNRNRLSVRSNGGKTTEAQSAVLPLVPYLDTLRWVFIALARAGIAVAIHARIDDWKKGLR